MPTLISGVQLSLRALLAQSQAVEITEHNVANASTPGYRRQAPILTASAPLQAYGADRGLQAGVSGTGVMMNGIQRFSLSFYDTRYRDSVAAWKQSSAESEGLAEVERILSETATYGIPSLLDAFWGDWQSLAADPTNLSLRSQLLSDSNNLTTGLHDRAVDLMNYRSEINDSLSGKVQQINDMATQVAALNAQIARYQNVDEQPNDFLDSRDRLLDQLAEISGAVSFIQPDGQASVSIGGHVLVAASESQQLQINPDPANLSLSLITWPDGQALNPQQGELRGLLQVRDTTIPQQLAALDDLAAGLATQVNAIHQNGFGMDGLNNRPFFTGNSALALNVNPALTASMIGAASAANQPANGTIADQLAQLREAKTMNGGLETFNAFNIRQAADLGRQVQSAQGYSARNQQSAEMVDLQRESLGGVSLDEEAANLVRYQKAYQAAARLMTTYDEMLDQVINRMGLVGR